MDLQQAQPLIVEDTGALMASLATDAPVSRKADTLCQVSRHFQALAICKLLVQADPDGFCEHLIRSGQSRRYYLKKSHQEGNRDDRFLGLSRVEAIMDAVVAGDSGLAREIADLSLGQWHDGWEYDDDFCYFALFHGAVRDELYLRSAPADALLKRLKQVLDGQPSARLRIVTALRVRDEEQVRGALEALLAEYAIACEARRARLTEYTADAAEWPRQFVSIEALAWLAIAKTMGIDLQDQFRFCPEDARNVARGHAVPDLFESLDRALMHP
jgi:hypothetical protein